MENKQLKIKTLLAEQLGLGQEDIHEDDSLRDDLHMSSTDLTDFSELLSENKFDTTLIDFINIETVGELIESITQDEI
ncbi:hypothetical protein A3A76_02650 [Candidatus Woesebacteria bacterium RIFCSPLOWO2_01_FULL_39_23]|uniref:Carrier domain-containing protein n=1 Tax=Candidatus Woesebacteria bacterium RIFCSPHIGHO2_01_FULL_40_22 TaxID=1802499 RepID=A0A1F7YJ56_9BACT|nr:MAG: hypothetical protein A2141_01375 [Candidatus Woesebacteria bacterium RBG_16_40_11]OGM27376.1 MAG: hypothetical protein A2628_01055 [Candidatus Woesebacteria bacterium RIFCSPHIGHO2_01_FULL_40_22]OGM37267.1 MAG: hypothetical protein A3E41_00265 [Candidatus Woesebacteria bacterium RIFCSPHIGHO2_12_FULL_38_9]OGM62548.1 MAG: hypothetical protein A3A76_02650 [Candidatus Woesebacteria bacterium RIFCSPLOWO2_01_FULL_39_23]